jgi:hypothetical protein
VRTPCAAVWIWSNSVKLASYFKWRSLYLTRLNVMPTKALVTVNSSRAAIGCKEDQQNLIKRMVYCLSFESLSVWASENKDDKHAMTACIASIWSAGGADLAMTTVCGTRRVK